MVAVFLGNVGAARQVLGFFSVCLGLVGGCGPDLLAGMAEGSCYSRYQYIESYNKF